MTVLQNNMASALVTDRAKVPYFQLNEKNGKYHAKRHLTDQQIIKAAKAILAHKVKRPFLLTSTNVVSDFLITHYSDKKNEVFVCLFCDTRHRLIAIEDLFTGTVDSAAVYPRNVLARTIELNASAVIFAHNHPSGSTTPSKEDVGITRLLMNALNPIGVRVLDHIIVAGDQSFSFAASGMISEVRND